MFDPHAMMNTSVIKTFKQRIIFAILISGGVVSISACQQLGLKNPPNKPAPVAPSKAEQPSAAPLEMSIRNISFAQTALNELGYQAGDVDGLWGPRSASAIRQFELDHSLASADGGLSELNLHTLEVVSGIDRNSLPEQRSTTRTGIAAKLNPATLRAEVPQLIITERPYPVLIRANPYSEVITTLPPGTGLYILNLQSGWYEVESTDNLRGYIRAE
ncbi:MAG: peptidoglycan-binding protein [Arenicella sp.]|nr:peptidoglycan-binding protein [Arenicella sp.]